MLYYNLSRILFFLITIMPVFRFYRNKYFYYVYVIAVIDPSIFLLRYFHVLDLSFYNHFLILSLLQILTIPLIDRKTKIFSAIPLLLCLVHFEQKQLVFLIIVELASLLLVYKLIESFYEGINKNNVGDIFLLLPKAA